MLSAFGHSPTLAVRGLAGEVDFDADSPGEATLRLGFSTGSLVVLDNIGETDRREIERKTREEVLEIAHFPEVVYRSLQVSARPTGEGAYKVGLNGELSLHGVTRNQAIEASVLVAHNYLHARGESTIRQSDYRIEPVTALGGAIKLKDELVLTFDIKAFSQ